MKPSILKAKKLSLTSRKKTHRVSLSYFSVIMNKINMQENVTVCLFYLWMKASAD